MRKAIDSLSHNGMKVLLVRHDSPIVVLKYIVNAGSWRESDPADYGAAHFLEHMLFKGTERKTYKQINEIAAALGDMNAYTGGDQTAYHIRCHYTDMPKALDLLTEMVFKSTLPEPELETERGVIQQERLAIKSSPRSFFGYEAYNSIWGDAWHWTIGTEESLAGMTRGRLMAFKNRHYTPGNIVLVAVGDIDPGELLDALEECEDFPDDFRGTSAPQPPLQFNDEHAELKHASKQAMVCLYHEGLSTTKELMLNESPDIFGNVFGGGSHSLLFNRVREELGLCYWCSAGHHSNPMSGHFGIFAELAPENIDTFVDEAMKLIQRCTESGDGIPAELLEVAKKNEVFGMARNMETSAGISNALAHCVYHLCPADLEYLINVDDRRKRIASLTVGDLGGFARMTFGHPVKLVTMTPEAVG